VKRHLFLLFKGLLTAVEEMALSGKEGVWTGHNFPQVKKSSFQDKTLHGCSRTITLFTTCKI